MKYYKIIVADIISYEARETGCDGIEITKDEYDKAITEINARIEAEMAKIEQEEKDNYERIAALEEENAALLYKLLTGEDLEDEE